MSINSVSRPNPGVARETGPASMAEWDTSGILALGGTSTWRTDPSMRDDLSNIGDFGMNFSLPTVSAPQENVAVEAQQYFHLFEDGLHNPPTG
jgi:hypothetical protein